VRRENAIASGIVGFALWLAPQAGAVTTVTATNTGVGDVAATATCPAGTKVLSGGGDSPQAGYLQSTLKRGNGWEVRYTDTNSGPYSMMAYAYCSAKAPALKTAHARGDANSGGVAAVTTKCPKETHVVSGGGAMALDDGSALVSTVKTRNGWSASGSGTLDNPSASGIRVYAYCSVKNFHLRKASSTSPTTDSDATAEAICPNGTSFVSGGGKGHSGKRLWKLAKPDGPQGFDAVGGGNITGSITAFAYCA
jgi:hypothetical protein